MARLRFLAVALLALVLAGSPTQTGRSADDGNGNSYSVTLENCKVLGADNGSCVIYALTDMGYDSDLGKWIAVTIPELIETKTWQEHGGTGKLRYYAPKNILIIKNSAAIQVKVNSFLKDLKKSMPKGSESTSAAGKKSPRSGIVPAEYRAPAPLATYRPVPETSSYPVPAPVKPPKHLFHFLIRYEGDGIIDDNVVKFTKNAIKVYNGSENETAARPTYAGGSSVSPLDIMSSEPGKKEDKKDVTIDKPGKENP